jgi:ABC-type multidrug transport system permease subunit
MMNMNPVIAVMEKALKESIRDKMVIFWTFAMPLFFLIMLPVMYGDIPKEIASSLKGGLALTMVTFLVMTAGQADLSGSIASDRERGLYLKMASMPVEPWKEGFGRVLAMWILSLLGAILVLLAGVVYGARFSCGFIVLLEFLGFTLLASLASVGIGLVIASLVKGESAATHTGVAVTLLTYFLGGMAFPYSSLPLPLQVFARIHPISSANASMVFLLEGVSFVGYNPTSTGQTALTVILSIFLFVIGLMLYSKRCWRKWGKLL